MHDQIEILSVDLLDRQRVRVDTFRRLAKRLGIELGWHYLLDLSWIANHLEGLECAKVLEAGAGTGVMQWWLAGCGAEVLSVDRTSRSELSARFRLRYQLGGLRPEDLKSVGELFVSRLQDASQSLIGRFAGGGARIASAALLIPFAPKARGEVIIYNQDLYSMTDIADESNDYAVAVSSLEHNDPEMLSSVVEEIMRTLKPGGTLLATLPAAKDKDWFHEPSSGWCFTEESLRSSFELSASTPSNFSDYDVFLDRLVVCEELQQGLSALYYRSGDNGMPWGVWDPQYQPVGIIKHKPNGDGMVKTDRSAG